MSIYNSYLPLCFNFKHNKKIRDKRILPYYKKNMPEDVSIKKARLKRFAGLFRTIIVINVYCAFSLSSFSFTRAARFWLSGWVENICCTREAFSPPALESSTSLFRAPAIP